MKTASIAAYNGSSNENLFGVSAQVTAALQEALPQIYAYPMPDAAPLRAAVADHVGVNPEQLVVGSGSAELISLLVRSYCQPFSQCNVVSVAPTYPLYQMEAEALGVQFKQAPLNSRYAYDLPGMLRQIDAETRILFLSNPNNPTGGYLTKTELEWLLREVPPHVLLVMDEAYLEYVSAPDYANALPYLPQHENLVVLRTFSKAYGLASLRVGYLIAQQQVVCRIMAVKQPFNVNQLAQIAAHAALYDQKHLHHTLEQTHIGKGHLQHLMQLEGVQWWPSEGNFLFVDAGLPARQLAEPLLENGIQVRYTDSNYNFRITVGTPAHQQHLREQLHAILSPESIWPNKVLAQILKTGYTLSKTDDVFQALATVSELAETANNIGTAAERIALAFARAFSSCLGPEGNQHTGNLYSSTFGETDMISAFNVLVKSTPLVTFGHHFGNLAIAETTAGASEIHILDLGIGGGLQWLHLLELFAARGESAPKIRITGVDIPSAVGAPDKKLQQTGKMLTQHAEKLGLRFSYTAIAQRLEVVNLRKIYTAENEVLVVNSAFTLHHLPDHLLGPVDYRDRILQQIKALQPAILTLTEPDSEHNKLRFLPRLRESLRHYYTVFDALDTLLPRLMPERQIIEQEFFGREIINVISCEKLQRVERHERHEAWMHRLIRNGFAPAPIKDSAIQIKENLKLHVNFSVQPNGAGNTLRWKETPVVAATAWV
ncbi:histidinol-phosphate transaminase [Pontibacter akesuensis]|uniref:histidinol-phosphate transaminase n=1 Tax=Pontibacter akesuensis TaxID=388950 RepID=A0A1I7H3A6_9BACT|nr:histidinol-phosphate transaminase [Pontibacter akesuensis]GHA53700.1 hypothetical protein GCM10007389_01140 [Pontibacter akesuensis]SFU55150.1 histidinol-phosphate aminotransferase [Pontibacter akesuensis]